MPAWYDLDTFRSRTGESTATDNDLIGTLEGVQASIIRYLGYDPYSGTVTEYYDTEGTREFVLRRKGVNSITSLWLDRNGNYGRTSGSFPSSTLLTSGADYALQIIGPDRTGVVYRLNDMWPFLYMRHINRLANTMIPCPGCVKVTYHHGEDDGVPADILDALYMEAAARSLMWTTGVGAQLSASLDSHSVSANQLSGGNAPASPFVAPAVASILAYHRRAAIY